MISYNPVVESQGSSSVTPEEPRALRFLGPVRKVLSRFESSDTAIMLTLAAVVGVGAGLGTVAFIRMIAFFQDLFFGRGAWLSTVFSQYWVILLPALGGLLVGPMIFFLAREAKGHGIPEVMTAMEVEGGRIRPVVIVVKAVTSAITIGSGGSVGREGPIVQIGAAMGSGIGQRLGLSRQRVLTLVASGAAAGLAATFNAPIAGVMFALEVLLGEYTVQAFSTMVFASVSASVVSRFFLGSHPAFAVPSYSLVSNWELLMYLGLGVAAAIGAGIFVRVLYFTEGTFDGWRFPSYLKPAVGGLALGVIGFLRPEAFGTGFSVIEDVLQGSVGLSLLLVLVLAKILATSLTLGSGASGGVFAPALFIGAVLGGAYGEIMHGLFPGLTATSGAYAMVGMAAVFAAAARAPITAIIILFEMTLDYTIMLPLMFATVVATVLAGYMERESIYTLSLVRRGIEFHGTRGLTALHGVLIEDVMTPAARVSHAYMDMRLEELARLFQETGHHGVTVMDEEGRLAGVVTLSDLERVLPGGDQELAVRDIYTSEVTTAYPDESLEGALRRAGALDVGRIPVVARQDHRKLLGLLRRGDIVRAYSQVLSEPESRIRELDRRRVEHASGSRVVEFGLAEEDVAVGKTLKELDLPPECLVVSIERGNRVVIPKGDTRLLANDHIVAMAPSDGGLRLRRCLKIGRQAADQTLSRRSSEERVEGAENPPTSAGD